MELTADLSSGSRMATEPVEWSVTVRTSQAGESIWNPYSHLTLLAVRNLGAEVCLTNLVENESF